MTSHLMPLHFECGRFTLYSQGNRRSCLRKKQVLNFNHDRMRQTLSSDTTSQASEKLLKSSFEGTWVMSWCPASSLDHYTTGSWRVSSTRFMLIFQSFHFQHIVLYNVTTQYKNTYVFCFILWIAHSNNHAHESLQYVMLEIYTYYTMPWGTIFKPCKQKVIILPSTTANYVRWTIKDQLKELVTLLDNISIKMAASPWDCWWTPHVSRSCHILT